MQNYIFRIYYERGEEFQIVAPDEKTAFQILWENHPEYKYFDVKEVKSKEINF